MSGYRNNEVALYLRPISNQQEYQLNNAAKWLVKRNRFRSVREARMYIHYLEYERPWQYKTLMSNYYAAHNMGHKFMKTININEYTTGNMNVYGDEPHMYM